MARYSVVDYGPPVWCRFRDKDGQVFTGTSGWMRPTVVLNHDTGQRTEYKTAREAYIAMGRTREVAELDAFYAKWPLA